MFGWFVSEAEYLFVSLAILELTDHLPLLGLWVCMITPILVEGILKRQVLDGTLI